MPGREHADVSQERDPVNDYARLKDGLLGIIDDLVQVEAVRGCPCEDLRDKLASNAFNLVVLGQFKRGKTSLINALLGIDILPVAVVPLTSIATIITYGEALRVRVYFNDGRLSEVKPESLAEYVTEKANPKNVKDVSKVVITYPSEYLKDGVRLIDTPGVGSVYQHNTDVAYQYLPKSDAALFLLSVDQPLSQAELDFLKDVRQYSDRIFFLLNKVDYFSWDELAESLAFSTNILREATGTDIKIYPVSARLALEGKTAGSEEQLQKSGLPAFSSVLGRFLMEEKGNVLITSVTNNLLRIISHACFEIDLEVKSLTTPLEVLKDKLMIFERKKVEVVQEKQDLDILLDGQVKALIKNVIDQDLEKVKKELTPMVVAGLESCYRENRGLPLKELHKALEEKVMDDVKQAYNVWRIGEDERISREFETICGRFIRKTDENVDSLLKFSSDLFSVPFNAVKAESLWTANSRFYYKFKEEPVGLEILAASLTFVLPKFLGEKIILKGVKTFASQVIDAQAGRFRYDFMDRLDKSKRDFRWAMLQRIESTSEGISTAIQKGVDKRGMGENEAEDRRRALSATAETLDNIKNRLAAIKESVGYGS
ncbi:MAG: dynamin family protein [Nitrospirota bacterium]